ncbi:MAG TPA: hypothetical protein VGX94_18815 [Terriglobia bacterium]|nr:hypothetical protein [Terriglobia bacterium]
MTNRFDFLEERLNKLENLALAEEQRPVIHGEPGTGNTGTETPEGQNRGSLSISNDTRTALRVDPIQEAQERLAMLAEEAISDVRRRLKGLADEMLVGFMADIERALQKCAGVMASQAIRLLEEEIKMTTRHSLQAGLVELATLKPRPERGPAATGTAATGGEAADLHTEKEEAELSTAVEALQTNSAPMFTRFDARLRATLQAFEENTAQQLAANFQKTVRELLARELESLRTLDGRAGNQPDQKPNGQPGAHGAAGAAIPSAVHSDRSCAQPEQTQKPPKKQTWRILGLS